MPWQEFATRLGLNPSNINHVNEESTDTDNVDDEAMATKLLDKDMCARIMAEWIKDPNHTIDIFLEHLDRIEREKAEETKRNFTEAVIGRRRRSRSSAHNRTSVHSEQSRESLDSNSTYRERMRRYASQQLGEQRTQTAHAVELCRMVLDTVEPMKTKIDVLYEKVMSGEGRLPYRNGGGQIQKSTMEEYV